MLRQDHAQDAWCDQERPFELTCAGLWGLLCWIVSRGCTKFGIISLLGRRIQAALATLQ